MSWIINGLAFVGCLTLIAIALLAWAVWRDDTSSVREVVPRLHEG